MHDGTGAWELHSRMCEEAVPSSVLTVYTKALKGNRGKHMRLGNWPKGFERKGWIATLMSHVFSRLR